MISSDIKLSKEASATPEKEKERETQIPTRQLGNTLAVLGVIPTVLSLLFILGGGDFTTWGVLFALGITMSGIGSALAPKKPKKKPKGKA